MGVSVDQARGEVTAVHHRGGVVGCRERDSAVDNEHVANQVAGQDV
jgi:hypothetical protein